MTEVTVTNDGDITVAESSISGVETLEGTLVYRGYDIHDLAQNAILQAQEFKKAVDITGIILAKLDGTARGGIVITIKDELMVPIKLIGTGEKPEDMEAFEPHTFVKSIF